MHLHTWPQFKTCCNHTTVCMWLKKTQYDMHESCQVILSRATSEREDLSTLSKRMLQRMWEIKVKLFDLKSKPGWKPKSFSTVAWFQETHHKAPRSVTQCKAVHVHIEGTAFKNIRLLIFYYECFCITIYSGKTTKEWCRWIMPLKTNYLFNICKWI